MPIEDIVATFDEHIPLLESLYTSRSTVLDRFNNGNGLDYLTILYQTLTPEQQKMFLRIVNKFTKNEKEYIQNPIVSQRKFDISKRQISCLNKLLFRSMKTFSGPSCFLNGQLQYV